MKKKKVLFLIESFIVGGAEKVLIDIVNNLDSGKYDITVCSVYKHSVYKGYDKSFEKPFKSHIKYRYLINNRIKILYVLFNYLLNKIPNILYQLFIGNKYDTLIAFYEGLPTYWVSQTQLKGCKKIAWLHTSTELSQKGKSKDELKRQEHYYAQFNQIVAVSQGVANSFTQLFPLLKEIVKIIYNPIDCNDIKHKSETQCPIHKIVTPTFISVGRITEVKGYDRILRVCKLLNEKNYQFQWWIIGGGNSSTLRNTIKQYNLEDRIRLLGHSSNPYPYILNADYFVSASYTEGWGMAIIEALTLNKPVICSNYPAAKEILGNNEYGIIYEQNDEALFNIIEATITNAQTIKSIEKKGKNRAYDFDINNQINHITNVLS